MRSPKVRSGWRSRLKNAMRAPSASLNTGRYLNELLADLDSSAHVLDLGSGTHRLRAEVVNLEIGPFPNVDVIGDGARLPLTDNSFDAVICQAVLEHVEVPEAIIAEVWRVLKPYGYVYVEVPFMQGYHADPGDYRRFTITGLMALLGRFHCLHSGTCVGPSSSLAWLLRDWISLFFAVGRARVLVRHVSGWLTFWIKYFDLYLRFNPESHVIASGLFFLGEKRL